MQSACPRTDNAFSLPTTVPQRPADSFINPVTAARCGTGPVHPRQIGPPWPAPPMASVWSAFPPRASFYRPSPTRRSPPQVPRKSEAIRPASTWSGKELLIRPTVSSPLQVLTDRRGKASVLPSPTVKAASPSPNRPSRPNDSGRQWRSNSGEAVRIPNDETYVRCGRAE